MEAAKGEACCPKRSSALCISAVLFAILAGSTFAVRDGRWQGFGSGVHGGEKGSASRKSNKLPVIVVPSVMYALAETIRNVVASHRTGSQKLFMGGPAGLRAASRRGMLTVIHHPASFGDHVVAALTYRTYRDFLRITQNIFTEIILRNHNVVYSVRIIIVDALCLKISAAIPC